MAVSVLWWETKGGGWQRVQMSDEAPPHVTRPGMSTRCQVLEDDEAEDEDEGSSELGQAAQAALRSAMRS